MTEKKYHVVFSGEVAEGEAIDNIKERMAVLFKTSSANIDALFKQKNAVIKRNVDEETAQKYVLMIRKTGAICRIAPADPASAPSSQAQKPPAPAEAPPPEKKAEPAGPRVVAIQLMHKGELVFAAQVIKKISMASHALNFNKMDIPEIPYKQIIAMAVYNEVDEDGQEKNKLLLFAGVSKRPFVCNAENIDYSSFSIDGTKSLIASFRNFLYFLCRQNPSIFVEESTFDFLSGSSPQKLDQNTILKLSTNMGKLIESGEMAAQT